MRHAIIATAALLALAPAAVRAECQKRVERGDGYLSGVYVCPAGSDVRTVILGMRVEMDPEAKKLGLKPTESTILPDGSGNAVFTLKYGRRW